MLKKKKGKWILLLVFAFAIFFMINFQYISILNFPDNVIIATGDIEYINNNNVFGKFIKVSLVNDIKQASVGEKTLFYEPTIKFKLFNLIPIKSKKVKLLSENQVLAGGNILGFVIDCEGAVVVQNNSYNSEIKVGDVLIKINGQEVSDAKSIAATLSKIKNTEIVTLTILRNNSEIDINHNVLFDEITKSKKLGLWVKSDAVGVGTLTFVTKDNRFGALGHPISETQKAILKAKSGKVYKSSVIGINKGKNGVPGEIRALFLQKKAEGLVDKNSRYGVYGWMEDESLLTATSRVVEIGGRLTASPGKAEILCSLDGETVRAYEIEIVKTNFQNYENDKSMVIKIVDQELLNKTGGIIQGMSGSPIIQNGKLIGAVTHVFINDSTRGFAVYIDWMIKE